MDLEKSKQLGRILSADGIRIGKHRIIAIVDSPTPIATKELRSVLGMVNFVRKVIPNLAGVVAPLTVLTTKEAVKEVAKRWSPEHNQAPTGRRLKTHFPFCVAKAVVSC